MYIFFNGSLETENGIYLLTTNFQVNFNVTLAINSVCDTFLLNWCKEIKTNNVLDHVT